VAIRRHWQLVCCAFSFCWWHHSQTAGDDAVLDRVHGEQLAEPSARTEVGEWKKSSTEPRCRPQVSWPVALRQVRAWLEPWIMLGRYWRGWGDQPPPPELQALLSWVWQGRGICLYETA
jgi:hypothetical protein